MVDGISNAVEPPKRLRPSLPSRYDAQSYQGGGDALSEDSLQSQRPPASRDKDDAFLLQPGQIQHLANFLVRLTLYAADNKDIGIARLSTRCVDLFVKMTRVFPLQNIKIVYFERLIQSALDQFSKAAAAAASSSSAGSSADAKPPSPIFPESTLLSFLEIMSATLDGIDGPSSLFLQNIEQVTVMFGSVYESDSAKVTD